MTTPEQLQLRRFSAQAAIVFGMCLLERKPDEDDLYKLSDFHITSQTFIDDHPELAAKLLAALVAEAMIQPDHLLNPRRN